jgi:ClpP class serine protease
MRVLNYLRSPSRIWAIEEGAWDEMVNIVEGQNLTPETIEANVAKLNNKAANAYDVVNGVAVIPVIGPIVKYGDLFSQISGATSVTRLTRDFTTALNDEDVKAIMFEIDSPGGEANGINEFAEQIYNARGSKPIQAYISGQGCSAAYWIASACDPDGVFLDETAMTGSIGVAAVVKDDEGKDANEGIKTYKFVSEGSENKRPDLETDEGKKVVLESLNAMAQVFRSKVARNRSNDNTSLTVRDVIEKFNRGGVLMGHQAVEAGLADGISSRREVLSNLISKSGDSDDTSLEDIQENIMSKVEDTKVVAAAPELKDDVKVGELTAKIETLSAEKVELATSFEELQKQFESLQAQVRAEAEAKMGLEKENLALKAAAAADGEFSGKIIPAQRDKFIKNYVQHATDDSRNPLEGGSRLEDFLDMWRASEDHNLEEEELTPDHVDLSNDIGADDNGIAELVQNAKAHAAKVNKTQHASN